MKLLKNPKKTRTLKVGGKKPKKKTGMKPSGNKQTKGRRPSKNKQTKGRPSKNKQTKGRKKSKKLSKKYSKKSINESEPETAGILSEKEVILKNIFKRGMRMKETGNHYHELNHVIIKPLVDDEAPSTVVLAAECAKPQVKYENDRYCGLQGSWKNLKQVVIKIESKKSNSQQIYTEESVLRSIKKKIVFKKNKRNTIPKRG